MKNLKLTTLLAASALFVTLGATNLNASMKCGAGKCGGEMKEKPAKKCGAGKCGGEKKMKKGKCGDAKKEKKKAMKCGAGKCGDK